MALTRLEDGYGRNTKRLVKGMSTDKACESKMTHFDPSVHETVRKRMQRTPTHSKRRVQSIQHTYLALSRPTHPSTDPMSPIHQHHKTSPQNPTPRSAQTSIIAYSLSQHSLTHPQKATYLTKTPRHHSGSTKFIPPRAALSEPSRSDPRALHDLSKVHD